MLAALALPACGGGESDEDQINEIAERAFLENDPAICDEIVTDNFIQLLFAGDIEACRKEAENPADDAESIEVTSLEVDGETASAEIKTVGGANDGQVIPYTFVKQEGDWKFDSAVNPAAASVLSAVQEQAQAAGLDEAAIDCAVERLQATLKPNDLSGLIAQGKPSPALQKKIAAAARECGTAK